MIQQEINEKGFHPCCHIGCDKPATKAVHSPPFSPDDYTIMCDEHAPEYVNDGDSMWDHKQPDNWLAGRGDQ